MDRRVFTEEDEVDDDLDDIDYANYKGIFYDDDPTTKYQDPETGAHFDFDDIWGRLMKIKKTREQTKETNDHYHELSAKEKLRLKLYPQGKETKIHWKNNDSDGDSEDKEMSILDEGVILNKENINRIQLEEDESHQSINENQRGDPQHLNEGLKFRNKFNDEDNQQDALFHRRHNDPKNPLHFQHRIHQTEEDEENVELIDTDFEMDNMWNLNEDKVNLINVLKNSKPNKILNKDITKYVKRIRQKDKKNNNKISMALDIKYVIINYCIRRCLTPKRPKFSQIREGD